MQIVIVRKTGFKGDERICTKETIELNLWDYCGNLPTHGTKDFIQILSAVRGQIIRDTYR